MFSLKSCFYSGALGLAVALSLVGCAQPLKNALLSPDAGDVTVNVYRAGGGTLVPRILVNSKDAGRLGPLGYLQRVEQAGSVTLEISSVAGSPDAMVGTSRAVTLAAGQASYWRLDVHAAAAGELPRAILVEMPAQEALREIRQLAR